MAAPHLTGNVIWRGQPGYDDARKDYNGRFSVLPNAIVYCQTAADVANAVLWARANHVPVSVRSGGHDYEAFSLVQGGLVIDVSPMNRITVDTANNQAVIQAGATLLPIYQTLWNDGVTIPGGSCGSVGISGVTLGGGFGLLSRNFGLTCDSLLGVQMVDASGNLLTADQVHHPDLFWACCGGGGGNFGVVTAFKFKTYAIGNVSLYYLSWPWGLLHDVIAAWQGWAPHTDPRLTSIVQLPAASSGQGPSSTGMFLGSPDELTGLVQPLLAVGSPTLHVQELPYIQAMEAFAGATPRLAHLTVHRAVFQKTFKNTSTFAFQPLSDAAIHTIVQFLQSAPGSQNLLQLDGLGGAVSQLAPDATAFPHRSALISMQYQAYWQNPGDAAGNIQWIDSFRRAMLSYVPDTAYRNYSDADLQGWRQAYYGNNLQRLIAVKKAYDPNNLFHYRQSIPEPQAPHPHAGRPASPGPA